MCENACDYARGKRARHARARENIKELQ